MNPPASPRLTFAGIKVNLAWQVGLAMQIRLARLGTERSWSPTPRTKEDTVGIFLKIATGNSEAGKH